MARKKKSFGCLFWLALVLLVLVIFLVNKKTIDTVFKTTRLDEVIQPYISQEDEDPQTPRVSREEIREEEPAAQTEPVITIREPEEEPTQTEQTTDKPTPQEETVQTGSEEEDPEIENRPAPTRKKRTAKLYFCYVASDGSISLKGTNRIVYFEDSPMTRTLESLLLGPSVDQQNANLTNLIPPHTKLLGARVKGSTAYLNFSKDFMYNTVGGEGYSMQLKQIIYTATEFSTVNNVQFMIEGKVMEYLNAEGLAINTPLNRASLYK